MRRSGYAVLCLLIGITLLSGTSYGTAPTLTLQPKEGKVGERIKAEGTATPGARVYIYFEGMLVATTRAQSNGTYVTEFFVPMVRAGRYHVVAEDDETRERTEVQVFNVTRGLEIIDELSTQLTQLSTAVGSLQRDFTRLQSLTMNFDGLLSQLNALSHEIRIIKDNMTSLQASVRNGLEARIPPPIYVVVALATSVTSALLSLYILMRRRKFVAEELEILEAS